MTYELARGLFLEDGPATQAANAAAARPATRFLRWRKLDSDRRLKAVEAALNAANDFDNLPAAL